MAKYTTIFFAWACTYVVRTTWTKESGTMALGKCGNRKLAVQCVKGQIEGTFLIDKVNGNLLQHHNDT